MWVDTGLIMWVDTGFIMWVDTGLIMWVDTGLIMWVDTGLTAGNIFTSVVLCQMPSAFYSSSDGGDNLHSGGSPSDVRGLLLPYGVPLL